MIPGTQLHNRYVIKRLIGAGGSAETFLALDEASGRDVVVKILAAEHLREWKSLDLFQREVELLKSIDYPLIPDYVDHFDFTAPGNAGYALVQEYVDGTNLSQLVKNGKRFSIEESEKIFVSLLETLVYIHGLSPPVIHRDIKPQNIMIDKNGKVFLVDFSAAGILRTTTAAAAESNTFVGTVGYMPPEQYYSKVFPQSDLYSLGVTMVFLLTGKDPAELELDSLKPEYKKYADVPDDLKQIIDLMIEMDVKKRPASAKEALRLFRKYTFIRKAAGKTSTRKSSLETGAMNTPVNFHYTKRFKHPLTKRLREFILNAVEFVFGTRGHIHSKAWETAGSVKWTGIRKPEAKVTIAPAGTSTRLDLIQPAYFSGIVILFAIAIPLVSLFVLALIFSCMLEGGDDIPFPGFFISWISMSGGLFLCYIVIKWIKEFRKARKRFRNLSAFLDHVLVKNPPADLKTLLYELCAAKDSILIKQSFLNMNLWLMTKWHGDMNADEKMQEQIKNTVERVFYNKRGKMEKHGLFYRWEQEDSPLIMSFLPLKGKTAIHFQMDRRNYRGNHAFISFGFPLALLIILTVIHSSGGETEDLGNFFLTGLFITAMTALPVGGLSNVAGTILSRRKIKHRLSKFVTALEELQE